MNRPLLKALAPSAVVGALLVAFTIAVLVGGLTFALHLPTVQGVPKTANPELALASSRQMILGLSYATLVVAFLVGRFREKTPSAVALVVDLLPIVWAFVFMWSLVHDVSELIPARKHPMFNKNALASAEVVAFAVALLPRRVRGQGAGVIGVLLATLAFFDVLHMRIFGNVVPVGSHGSFWQLWDVRASIASLIERRDLWIALYVVTAASLIALWRVRRVERMLPVVIVAYLIPVGLLAPSVNPIRDDVTKFLDSKWAKEVLNREDQVWNAGFFEAHIREISLNVKNSVGRKKPSPAELEQVRSYYAKEHEEHFTSDRPSFGEAKGKNLLVLQLEAFEEWLIDATVDGQEITPFLNSLKKRGLFYPNIYDIAAQSHTADTEYLVLNGNHPLADAPVAFRAEDNHFVTIATTLRDHGYSTLSMHGYRRGMWNRAVLHPRYGFSHSLFAEELGDTPKIGWGLDDHVLFHDLVGAAKAEKTPWLLYAITLSSHHPYDAIPWNKRRLHVGSLQNTMLGEYMHSAAFVDDAIAQLWGELEAAGILKDTVVVLYGDHAALIKTSARDRAGLAAETNLPKNVVDHIGTGSLNRVPLLVMIPGHETGETVHAFGAQIDIGATALHFLGIETPRSFLGYPLTPEQVGGFVARWDGSFVSPPLAYDAGIDECRVLVDQRVIASDACRGGADRAREQLAMSWLVTNNDLAGWLVRGADAIKPPKRAEGGTVLGGSCQQESDCAVPAGFDARCLHGLCVTDPHGPCAAEGDSSPCALGSACYRMGADLDVCSASCDVYACAGRCTDARICGPSE